MQSSEFVAPSQLQQDIILDTDPTVRMDIAFGKKLKPGHVIDFDYSALRESLVHVGAPADSSDLTISIYPAGVLSLESGSYFEEENNLYIGLSPKYGNLKKYQKFVQHELQHYADRDTIINESPAEKAIFNFTDEYSPKLAKVTFGVIAAGILNNIYSSVVLNPPGIIEPISDGITDNRVKLAAVCAGALITSIAPYHFNRHEIRARKAARTKLRPVLVINRAVK